ncbi:hypothetical protein L4D06_14750 [Enterovibrio makurazakiensis]|uniref:hypothetical protein n=1 Tax=Enterovibrio makurazakiensis TaxID=2910232 RepID=UPI003D25D1BD
MNQAKALPRAKLKRCPSQTRLRYVQFLVEEKMIELLGNSGLFTFQKVIKSTPTRIRYGKAGLLDTEGKVLLENDFDHFGFNSELNIIVAQQQTVSDSRSTYLYGIFDMKGEQLVPLDYDHVLNEQGAIINLRKDGLWYEYPAK